MLEVEAEGFVEPLIIDEPERSIFKVNRSSMTMPAVLERERTRIFDACWLFLGHASEIPEPGSFKTRDVGGRALLFTRSESGVVRAFYNACPHRGAMVCREEEGTAKRFTCFYHGWTFRNEGDLLTLPDEASYGPGFDKSRLGLVQVSRLECYRGFIFVSFNPDIEDLESYLDGAREYLDLVADQGEDGMEAVGGSQRYAIRANWKLLVENSIDGYHAGTTHATYLAYLKDLGTDLSPGISGVGRDLGHGHAVIDYVAPWGRPIALWEPSWGESARLDVTRRRQGLVERFGEERATWIAEHNRNLFIFPNLIVNDIMSITVRTFWPVEPGYMTVSAWALGPRGEEANLRALRLDSFLTFLGPGGFATPDDVEALEMCQRGFTTAKEAPWSDISRGINRDAPKAVDEEQMRAFWRRWNALMTGDRAVAVPALARAKGGRP